MSIDAHEFEPDFIFGSYSDPSPMAHEFNAALYRVAMKVSDGKYKVYVADNYVRSFSDKTLPDFIRHKLTMIRASPERALVSDRRLSRLSLFASRGASDGFDMVGWQASDSMYVIILTNEQLEDMRGGN